MTDREIPYRPRLSFYLSCCLSFLLSLSFSFFLFLSLSFSFSFSLSLSIHLSIDLSISLSLYLSLSISLSLSLSFYRNISWNPDSPSSSSPGCRKKEQGPLLSSRFPREEHTWSWTISAGLTTTHHCLGVSVVNSTALGGKEEMGIACEWHSRNMRSRKEERS